MKFPLPPGMMALKGPPNATLEHPEKPPYQAGNENLLKFMNFPLPPVMMALKGPRNATLEPPERPSYQAGNENLLKFMNFPLPLAMVPPAPPTMTMGGRS